MSSDSEDVDDVEPDPETVDVSAFTVIPIMLVLSFSFKFSLKSLMRRFKFSSGLLSAHIQMSRLKEEMRKRGLPSNLRRTELVEKLRLIWPNSNLLSFFFFT